MSDAWQPIETAPRDGTRILVWWRGRRSQTMVRISRCTQPHGSPYVWVTDGTGRDTLEPTHWMPLPPPPEGARDE
jgi:hypothetical protein